MRWLIAALLLSSGSHVYAWGDKGHRVIALIAQHYLSPRTRDDITALLSSDQSGPAAADFVSTATWADAYRDSDRDSSKTRFEQTRRWHYINLALNNPDFARACFGSPTLPPQHNASDGPAQACIVDKVNQFAAELKSARTPPTERLLALRFLIHLVGDLHQPLHTSDHDDKGGNEVLVSAKGFKRGTLHGYWDSASVAGLGRKPEAIARRLIARMDAAQRIRWQRGDPRDWALESLTVARDISYGKLPPADGDDLHHLDEAYIEAVKNSAAQQLMRAGVRLAWLLEQSTFPHQP